MTPAEILSSESQERMCAVVTPEDVDAFLAVCREVGHPRHGDRRGHRRRPAGDHLARRDRRRRAAAHGRPRRAGLPRPVPRDDARQDALVADVPDRLPRPAAPSELRAEILRMAASPNLCSRAWVTDQYDRYVRGNTASAQPADAGVVRVDEETGRGVAVATDCNARFVALDPYTGTQLALAEAYRNVATSGAVPQAVTNCLNFGSPEDPHVMWQFAEAVRGLADGCAALGIPVTGGNVSFYNQTGVDGDPADAGGRGAGRDRRRRAPGAQRVHARRRRRAAARRRPATSSAAASGPTSCTATWAAARPPWTSPPSSASPACSPPPPPTGC